MFIQNSKHERQMRRLRNSAFLYPEQVEETSVQYVFEGPSIGKQIYSIRKSCYKYHTTGTQERQLNSIRNFACCRQRIGILESIGLSYQNKHLRTQVYAQTSFHGVCTPFTVTTDSEHQDNSRKDFANMVKYPLQVLLSSLLIQAKQNKTKLLLAYLFKSEHVSGNVLGCLYVKFPLIIPRTL